MHFSTPYFATPKLGDDNPADGHQDTHYAIAT
jgi:hypothetical protein